MAYYVIARDPKTHDEWVMPKTFDTILETAEYAEKCRTEDPRFRYRLEGKDTDTYGIHVEVPFPDTRTKDFTVAELFPMGTDVVAYTLTCAECSCEVKNVLKFLEGHTAWHNKLLP